MYDSFWPEMMCLFKIAVYFVSFYRLHDFQMISLEFWICFARKLLFLGRKTTCLFFWKSETKVDFCWPKPLETLHGISGLHLRGWYKGLLRSSVGKAGEPLLLRWFFVGEGWPVFLSHFFSWVVVSHVFGFFQMGWNHQLARKGFF